MNTMNFAPQVRTSIDKFISQLSTCRAAKITWLTFDFHLAARDVHGYADFMPYTAQTKRNLDFQMQNFTEFKEQKVDTDTVSCA